MSTPRFSIVIPTRNRHATLKYALLTCLNQKNFNDYEIIVCDNCSSIGTRETVDSFESEKIKYIRSDRPLAMSQNWELAISHAEGEYVIVIGDDDGLLLNALDMINQLLRVFDVKALHWQWIYYNWPNAPEFENRLVIPIVRKNQMLNSRKVIQKMANFEISYGDGFPMIYRSAIHRTLIDLLRNKTGSLFPTESPDVYSGFAFAHLAKNYISIGLPLGIAGKSSFSTGFATTYAKDNLIAQEFWLLSAEANRIRHPRIPDIPVNSAYVGDSFLWAKDNLFPNDENICINRKRLTFNCVNELRERSLRGIDGETEWRMHLGKIRDSLADDRGLQLWFDKKFKDHSRDEDGMPGWYHLIKKIYGKIFDCHIQEYCSDDSFKKGFNGSDLVLDAAEFGLENVFDVAEFCGKLCAKDINEMQWTGQGIKLESLIEIKRSKPYFNRILKKYVHLL